MRHKTLVGSAILIFAGVVALLAMLVWQQGSIHPASAASGCADLDGNGTVEMIDVIIVSDYYNLSGTPAPPKQADQNKDGVINLFGDILPVLNQLKTSTSCQTNTPLPKTTPVGGALAVDAVGESTSLNDTVQTKRSVTGGGSFVVSVHVTANPGTISGYGLRLHWDEALLGLNVRSALANDRWSENVPGFGISGQVLGPGDDGAGSEAYIELGGFSFQPDTLGWSGTGPTAQFEFICQGIGTANITLTDAGSHSVLLGRPAIQYTPTLANAQINCLSGPTPTPCPSGKVPTTGGCGTPTLPPTATPTPTSAVTPTPCPDGKVPANGGCGTPTPTPTPCPEGKVPANGGCGTPTPTPTVTPTKQPFKGDTDGDGCPDTSENRPKAELSLGGGRDYKNPWDYYDVDGDGDIDLFGDILGVIAHFSLNGLAPYDVIYDRGPTQGPNSWNMTAPDGVINLFTDILGVIKQYTLTGCT